jgi:hypothetical protein
MGAIFVVALVLNGCSVESTPSDDSYHPPTVEQIQEESRRAHEQEPDRSTEFTGEIVVVGDRIYHCVKPIEGTGVWCTYASGIPSE